MLLIFNCQRSLNHLLLTHYTKLSVASQHLLSTHLNGSDILKPEVVVDVIHYTWVGFNVNGNKYLIFKDRIKVVITPLDVPHYIQTHF